jgi:hypothetical protein
MGTSASSKGPGGGVPMVPPWVPDPVPQDLPQAGDDLPPVDSQPDQVVPQQPAQQQPSPLAPRARFGGTRLNLGNFARSGNRRDMQRGLRDYVRNGYGGRATAVRRFGNTAATAGQLYGALSGIAAGRPAAPGTPLTRDLLAGRSAREVMDAIVEAVRPADGTQDAEANRASIKDALSELLTTFPNADLLNLTQDQLTAAIERFVAIDVYRRAALDIGKTILDKAPTATAGLSRLKEIKDYIKETVAAAFRRLRDVGERLTTGRVNHVVRGALEEAFQVFEAYVG